MVVDALNYRDWNISPYRTFQVLAIFTAAATPALYNAALMTGSDATYIQIYTQKENIKRKKIYNTRDSPTAVIGTKPI